MALARLPGLHRERGSSQRKGRSHQLPLLYQTPTRPPPADTNRPDTDAPGNTAVAAANRSENCRKRGRSGPEGKGRSSSGQVQNTTLDWLMGGRIASLLGLRAGASLCFALCYRAEGACKFLWGKGISFIYPSINA